MQKIFRLFAVSLFSLVMALSLLPDGALAEETDGPNVNIAKIALGGGDEVEEFATLYNPTDSELNLDGWSLEYAKNDFTSAYCGLSIWADAPSGGYSQPLDGLAIPAGGILSVPQQLNNTGSGSLRVVQGAGIVHDLVGWGSEPACYETTQTSIPSSGKIIQRYLDCDIGMPVDSNVNIEDFAPVDSPSTSSLSELYTEDCLEPDDSGDDGSEPATSCEGIVISELLPNSAGVDTGHEFIELYNPTNASIGLSGCSLQLDDGPLSPFGDIVLQTGHYMAFYDDNTGITLPNSAGGTVYLLDSSGELDSVSYPGGLDDDTAWARFASGWEKTYLPTPGSANTKQPDKPLEPCPAGQFRNPETNRCNIVGSGGSTLKPCRSDQFRNPLTNRCKLRDDDSSLKPCRTDQFRNPETNRCKLISSAGSSLKPCSSDQFRNPETNRCKKIDSGYQLKPCDKGEERNPETNRCRMVRGASTDDLPEVKDVEAPIISGGYSWLLAGVAGGGVLAYGVWEWRRELLALLAKLRP